MKLNIARVTWRDIGNSLMLLALCLAFVFCVAFAAWAGLTGIFWLFL